MKHLTLYNTNRPLDVLLHWHNEKYLDLNPPYQRGKVWGLLRKQNLIKSLIQGIPIASLIINDRTRHPSWEYMETGFMAMIDGKQRTCAILDFLNSVFGVPGEWFDQDVPFVFFSTLPIARQRGFRNMPIAVSEGSLQSLEQEEEVFNLVNFGGVPQGERDEDT